MGYAKLGKREPLSDDGFGARIDRMNPNETKQGISGFSRDESFFADPADPRREARALASEAICRLLIWMADGRTLHDRGLRACVALFCIRPDLIDDSTLESIGTLAGCSRQAVHKLTVEFRETTGLQA